MKKLVIEIPAEIETEVFGEPALEAQLEDGDFEVIKKLEKYASMYIEFGAPHSNQAYAEMGIAECFAIDIRQFTVRIEEVPDPITMEDVVKSQI